MGEGRKTYPCRGCGVDMTLAESVAGNRCCYVCANPLRKQHREQEVSEDAAAWNEAIGRNDK